MKTDNIERKLKTDALAPAQLGLEAAVVSMKEDGTVTINGYDLADWEAGLEALPARVIKTTPQAVTPFIDTYQRPDVEIAINDATPFVDAYQRPDAETRPELETPFVDSYQRPDVDVTPEQESAFIEAYQRR